MTASTLNPAHILGCSPGEARLLLHGRRVTPGEVESVALKHYAWRRHLRDPESYWVTASQAASILRMSPQRVKQLLDERHLPFVMHASGVRLMRRAEIRAIRDAHLFDSVAS